MQQPVRKDVAALGIGGQLHFVDCEEIDIDLARHRLDRRHPETRALRFYLFLARDQRDFVEPDAIADLVVDFARQQPQRQADHACLMVEHALDGQMRLSSIGRAQNRRDMADAGVKIKSHERSPSSFPEPTGSPSNLA